MKVAAPTPASRIAPSTIRVGRFIGSPCLMLSVLVLVLLLFLINVYECHRMGLGSTCSATVRPTIGGRPVHRDARPTGQFVLERRIEDQLAGMCQPGQAYAIVARLVKAGQGERRQLHEIIRRSDPARLVIERQEVRPAVSGVVLR